MNEIKKLHETYSYMQIARRIEEKTGRMYHPQSLANASREGKVIAPSMLYYLFVTFPEVFAPSAYAVSEEVSQTVEAA